ncbi:response regulator transcription factor [Actinomadura sp. NPDC049753]|uniref:response regulator transcription factor n=1 Tax=Actinomadura sp. NPDC049753 TaxID=3154739 RepID=UPI0034285DE6
MDIRMPGMDGLDATQMITADTTAARVLMLTTYDEDANVYASLRAGASGFLVKDMALDDMITAIRVVAAGDALIAPSVTRRLIAEFAGRPEPAPPPAGLPSITDRERQVLTLVGRGLSNVELAAELHISPGTAETHVANLLTKLGARDRVQLSSSPTRTDSSHRPVNSIPESTYWRMTTCALTGPAQRTNSSHIIATAPSMMMGVA